MNFVKDYQEMLVMCTERVKNLQAVIAAVHKIPDEHIVAVLDVSCAVVGTPVHLKNLQQVRKLAVNVAKQLRRGIHLHQHWLFLHEAVVGEGKEQKIANRHQETTRNLQNSNHLIAQGEEIFRGCQTEASVLGRRGPGSQQQFLWRERE